ncbi:MAG TPA: hypothetical protein VGP28_02990 [Methylocella sp.]|jgi:hypothetical protein|nr:hypothetical protein [Methylocella sp.]
MSTGRGMAQKSIDLIEHSRRILAEIHPSTVRGVAYQLFVAGFIDDMGAKNTSNVSRLLVVARENGIIPWSWIVDETRQEERASTWNGLGDFGEVVTRAYRKDFWQHQESWLKVFSEKATIGGVVRPVLNEFAVGFQVLHGFGSATSVHDVAEESLTGDRDLEILYIGDFDPSGMYMSEVDLPGRIQKYEGNATITRIALTEADCTEALPAFAIETKSKDPRFRWFRENYGRRCWELDAMNPNALRQRVRDAVLSRIDHDAWAHCETVEVAERESLNKYIKAWAKA